PAVRLDAEGGEDMSVLDRVEGTIKTAVVTISDTRTKETDKGGRKVLGYLQEMNVEVDASDYIIVKDDREESAGRWKILPPGGSMPSSRQAAPALRRAM